MLIIKTDLKNTEWLTYILFEFKKTNLALFDIKIINSTSKIDSQQTLYYTKSNNNYYSVYNSNQPLPNGKITYIEKDLYVLEKTTNKLCKVNYDLFWNAFVFLSRLEEYLSEKNGINIYSYSTKHPRKEKKSFETPIVNILFNKLEDLIKSNFKNLKFGNKKKPQFDLSHDLDYIKKTIQLRFKQTVFNTFNTIRCVKKPFLLFKNIVKTAKFACSNPNYWRFDYWENLESTYKQQSTFYIYAKTSIKQFKSWLIDPSYNIRTNKKLQDKLKELYDKGFEIGLHGSYQSALVHEQLAEEKHILEKSLNLKVTKTRQHWLNYQEGLTPYSHNKLFKTDSTLGWNDRIGFRSGICNKYKPYDFKNKKPFNYEIIPLIIMDSNVFDYSNDPYIFNKAKQLIQVSKKITKTTYVSISWHQRVCSSDYNWHLFYKKLLDEIEEN